RWPILGLGGLQVLASTGLIGGSAAILGLAWSEALAVGMILALSSTAIVLQTLQEKGLMRTAGGQSAFAVLLFQDIAVIPMLALFPLLTTHAVPSAEQGTHASGWTSGLPAWLQTVVVLGAVAAIVVGGHFVIKPGFRYIARTKLREIFVAAALLLV